MTNTKKLKVGIDSYCFHRLFGEVYPHQYKIDPLLTMEDFLALAKNLDVDGVSLESCFFFLLLKKTISHKSSNGWMINPLTGFMPGDILMDLKEEKIKKNLSLCSNTSTMPKQLERM